MSPRETSPEDNRQLKLLEAAVSVFLRFGFRKTSMDDVAQAAHISRQGLYLHFKTKEELFTATVQHLLASSLARARVHLTDETLALEPRLIAAFDEVVGRFIGVMRADASDLAEVGSALVGSMVSEHEDTFIEAIAQCFRNAGLSAAYRPLGLNARKLAESLYATARGLKYGTQERAEFVERLTVAVRVLCFPLRSAP